MGSKTEGYRVLCPVCFQETRQLNGSVCHHFRREGREGCPGSGGSSWKPGMPVPEGIKLAFDAIDHIYCNYHINDEGLVQREVAREAWEKAEKLKAENWPARAKYLQERGVEAHEFLALTRGDRKPVLGADPQIGSCYMNPAAEEPGTVSNLDISATFPKIGAPKKGLKQLIPLDEDTPAEAEVIEVEDLGNETVRVTFRLINPPPKLVEEIIGMDPIMRPFSMGTRVPEVPVDQRCHEGCPGWVEDGGGHIERCDDCKRFPNDEAAAEFAAKQHNRRLRYVLEPDGEALPFGDPREREES